MAKNFTTIDLSDLPSPKIIEELSFEDYFNKLKATFEETYSEYSSILESDPVIKLVEAFAYRELMLRNRINDAAKAVMLAYAVDSDLDQIGANFGVTRKLESAGNPDANPPTEDVYETDSDFRIRIQLSLEGLSVAGSKGAYIFHALSVTGVSDVAVTSPVAGNVKVTILSNEETGVPSVNLLTEVGNKLSGDDIRPLTDNVSVEAPTIKTYAVEATIYTYDGPDPSVVIAEAQTRVEKYVADSFRLGRDIPVSSLYAALHVEGVQRVELASPVVSIVNTEHEAARNTGITLTNGGVDE